MSNLAVCVQYDNKNVSPKETINAIYKAGFKNVYQTNATQSEFKELNNIETHIGNAKPFTLAIEAIK